MATRNGDAMRSSTVRIDLLGLCSSATMLAEYEVNKARVAKNVVNTTNWPDVVRMMRCVPCWQVAPQTNVAISITDTRPRSSGCRAPKFIMMNTNIRSNKQQPHTFWSKGRMKMFETAERGGCRNMVGVLGMIVKWALMGNEETVLERTWCGISLRRIRHISIVRSTWLCHELRIGFSFARTVPWRHWRNLERICWSATRSYPIGRCRNWKHTHTHTIHDSQSNSCDLSITTLASYSSPRAKSLLLDTWIWWKCQCDHCWCHSML